MNFFIIGLNPQGYDQFGYTVEGYDADYCNFHFNGSYAPRQSLRIFEVLRQQSKPFLMSLVRTCPGLHAVPDLWLKQTWVTERKVIAGEMMIYMTVVLMMLLDCACSGLHAVPDLWLKQTWVTERKVIAGEMMILYDSYVNDVA